MRFTKRQKEIIQKIGSGEIWDLFSFVKVFQSQRTARYDWKLVQQAFRADPKAQEHYCAKKLSPTPANLIPADVFVEKLRQKIIDPSEYVRLPAELKKTCAKQEETVLESSFSFDFYQGVPIAASFEELVEFLAIWQLLRRYGLVLDVPQPLTAETVGLFFEESDPDEIPPFVADENSETLCFSDRRYLTGRIYRLSRDHLAICQEFLGRRLYPAPGLKLFIQNRFRTQDEVSQSRSLLVTVLAILVSFIVGLFPYLFSPKDSISDVEKSHKMVEQAGSHADPDEETDITSFAPPESTPAQTASS